MFRLNHGDLVQSSGTMSSTRSTCAGGVLNSGEHDFAIPVVRVLGLSLGKLYGLPGRLPRGLDRAEEDGKRVGHGGCPRAALAGRGEVTEAAGWLGKARRGAEGGNREGGRA